MEKRDNFSRAEPRQSGIELLCIIMMLIIIAHHYVVNSGLLDVISYNKMSFRSLFLLIFGWGANMPLIVLLSLQDILCAGRKLRLRSF